jgi:hypothetical protein
VRGRSARTHAALHTGRSVVARFDIEDFFAGVSAGRIYAIFRAAGYPQAVAHHLTGLSVNVLPRTEWEDLAPPREAALLPRHHRLGRRLAAPHLPQGASTSSALASLASFGLDVRLSALAASLNLTYSRYADDLTFSGAPEVIDVLRAAVPDVVRSEGLRLNPGKTRIRSQASRQLVGGSVVNRRVNVPRDDYDRLKAVLHDATRHGPAAANRTGVDFERTCSAASPGWKR